MPWRGAPRIISAHHRFLVLFFDFFPVFPTLIAARAALPGDGPLAAFFLFGFLFTAPGTGSLLPLGRVPRVRRNEGGVCLLSLPILTHSDSAIMRKKCARLKRECVSLTG
jgi:hypothetical protein